MPPPGVPRGSNGWGDPRLIIAPRVTIRELVDGADPEEFPLTDPQANKQTAIEFYELMFNDTQPREATERYTGADYRQHNPGPTVAP